MNKLIHSAYFSNEVKKKSNHYHDCHQILFVQNGTVEVYVNKTKHIVTSGNIAIFSRYENHSINVISDDYERFVLQINPFIENRESKVYSLFLNRPSGFNNIFDVSQFQYEFKQIFLKILDETESENLMASEMQNLLINQIVIMLYRLFPGNFAAFEDEKFDLIFEIQRRFETNYSQQYTLNGLAKEYCISVSTLLHQFKRVTGFSVFEYLHSCRMASAKYYLAKTHLSICEIIEKCGFTDNSNFSRSFKKKTGLTPSQFRNKYKII